jgi:phospholipid transport system substrate-binding protein
MFDGLPSKEGTPMLYWVALSRFGACRAATVALLFLVAGFLAGPPAAFAAPQPSMASGDPMIATKALVDGALGILRDPHLSLHDRRERLRALADAHLDFDAMAHSTLGHHWSELTPEQRTRFTGLFRTFMENAYLGKIQDYSGQKVVFVREKLDGAGDSKVLSKWVANGASDGDEPDRLIFMLHRDNGEWKIYDLTVDGVGITSNYRNQFDRVLDNQSFDTLMSRLKMKNEALAARLGK